MSVYIPTLGRAAHGHNTLKAITSLSDEKVVLVVSDKEYKDYKRRWGKQGSVDVVVCPAQGVRGIGAVRQWILENGVDNLVMMADDDMTFSWRDPAQDGRLVKAPDLRPMFRQIRAAAKIYQHGGVSQQAGNNHQKKSFSAPSARITNFHFIRKSVLALGARMDCLSLMEDFYFTLSLLAQGVPNYSLFSFSWNQGASGAAGGCALYRTAEKHAQAAHDLHAAFPDFVTVVTKKTKGSGVFSGERTDVRIQWKKAYLSGLAKTKP